MLDSPWMALALQWFLTPSTAAAAAFAVVTSILFRRARKQYLSLPLLPEIPPGETPPDCMVVVPARNEEHVVAGAVKSFPPDTVIVVDDHSTDKTAAKARAAGAGVLEAPPLQGALGKANACMAGAQILTSRWILFADADTRYQRSFLESVVQWADNSRLYFVSVHLTPRPQSLLEHLVEPYTTVLFFGGARLRRDPMAMFNGHCILALRQAYEFIGGHAAISKYLAEALNLGLVARRHRMPCAVARAGELGYVRSHTGWKGAWKGIERQAFRFIHMSPWRSLAILGTAVCAALWLPLAVWLWITGHRVAPGLLVLLVLLQLRPWYGKPYGNKLRVLLAPLAIYAALPFVLHGVIGALVVRHVDWKGRRIRAT